MVSESSAEIYNRRLFLATLIFEVKLSASVNGALWRPFDVPAPCE
jgi:hypothetical protein